MTPRLSIIAAAILQATTPQGEQPTSYTWADDFDTLSSRWVISQISGTTGASMTVSSGALTMSSYGTGSSWHGAIATAEINASTDFDITFTAVTANNPTGDLGYIFLVCGPISFSFNDENVADGNVGTSSLTVDGVSKWTTSENTLSHDIRFVRSGSTATVYRNGTQIWTGTCTTTPATSVVIEMAQFQTYQAITFTVGKVEITGLTTQVAPGMVAKLDAKDYTSGQVWANARATPSDGSAQTAYDYNLGDGAGANGSDPAIQNSGGNSAYWEMDGSDDEFTHTLVAGSMPAFLRAMHKAGTKFTIEAWMRWDGTTANNIAPLFDSGSSDQGGSDMSRGVLFGDLGSDAGVGGKLNLRLKQDSGGTSAFTKTTDAVIPSGAIQMLAVSFDGTGTDASFFYRNGAYMQAGSADTWTASLTSPGTADTANRSKIGASGDGAYHVPSGTRIYILRLYNRNLTKAELDVNWNGTKGRYGL